MLMLTGKKTVSIDERVVILITNEDQKRKTDFLVVKWKKTAVKKISPVLHRIELKCEKNYDH